MSLDAILAPAIPSYLELCSGIGRLFYKRCSDSIVVTGQCNSKKISFVAFWCTGEAVIHSNYVYLRVTIIYRYIFAILASSTVIFLCMGMVKGRQT